MSGLDTDPHPLTLESWTRNLYNDDAKGSRWPTWHRASSEVRREYRKIAWALYVEHMRQRLLGIFDGDAK